MNNYCIKLNNISKSINHSMILNDVNLQIHKGKITSIIGSNGCGKSTLLSLLSKQTKPTNCEVLIDDKLMNEYSLKELSKKVSIVNQINNIDSDITVYDFVKYARIPHQGLFSKLNDNDLTIINDTLNICELTDLKDRSINSLSGGQKQRVFIALAIAKECPILLLDEPTTYMDIKYQISLLNIIKKLNIEKQISIIMVLHDVNQAIQFSDYIVGMKNGDVIFNEQSINIKEKDLFNIYDIPFNIKEIDGKQFAFFDEDK